MIEGVAVIFHHKGAEIQVRMPKPNRHCDCFRHATDVLHLPVDSHKGAENQGFYTDKGRYLNRVQAWNHVKRVGQELLPDHYEGEVLDRGPLFSEDVW